MKRKAAFILCLAIAVCYTLACAIPVFRAQVGPCSVCIHCPSPAGDTVFYYELEGQGLYRSIRIRARPGGENCGWFRNLPPGQYILRCAGVELAELMLSTAAPAELWPGDAWPVFSPK